MTEVNFYAESGPAVKSKGLSLGNMIDSHLEFVYINMQSETN